VQRGAMPEISVTENQQNIIRRQILVAESERNFAVAANALSFYYRDGSGNPIVPAIGSIPSLGLLTPLEDLAAVLNDPVNLALADRPELRSLRVAIDRARNKVSLSENDLKPDLDVSLEVSRDVGDVAEGGISRDSTDTIVGFRFSLPLQRREARGKLQRAEAELRAARLREQRLEDQIEIELNNILVNLGTALRLASLAEGEVVQSETMVEAERRRFNLGASDFFLVNVREETAADARIRAIRAELTGRLARTSYDAATLNLDELGLTSATR
ncbi:MAG: TolC family protein, partial [Pseudomonadota bacterium]